MYFSGYFLRKHCNRKTQLKAKRMCHCVAAMALTTVWILVIFISTVLSHSIVDRTKVKHDKQVLDYTLIGERFDYNSDPEAIIDESHYQRDIEDVNGHMNLYHKDTLLASSSNAHVKVRKVLNNNQDVVNTEQETSLGRNETPHISKERKQTKSVIKQNSRLTNDDDNKNSNDNRKHINANMGDTMTEKTNSVKLKQQAYIEQSDLNINISSSQSYMQNTNTDQKQSRSSSPSQRDSLLAFNVTSDDDNDKSIRSRLPKAIIIGVKKAGTRALLEFLKMHPDIKAPGPEPHFFDKNYEKGYDWYRNQMPASEHHQITMEKSPSYYITKECPSRIYNMNPDTKLIVVVRDPVTRAISDYTQGLERRPDMKPFEQMAFLDNNTNIINISWTPIKIGMYIKHLEKWLKYFPLKQIHFVDGEKLISEPANEVNKVQKFLAIRTVINDKYFSFNSTKGFPCLVKQPHSTKAKPHCFDDSKGRQHPKVSDKAIYRLKEFYTPFNQKLYILLGHNFGW